MNIGFDAKRAYHNGTGLGHYSRTLIRSLSHYHPNHQYYLFNPRKSGRFEIEADNLHQVLPTGLLSKMFSAAWRSSWVKTDLRRLQIDLYHGLSHEIPLGIHQTRIKSTVTIHDLIHERYPDQYNTVDLKIYSRKFRYACENADRVIAISEQTKQDIIDFYKTPAGKIRVCYQSCNPSFGEMVGLEDKKMTREKYGLPDKFFLYVGSIIERKNLLNICKAIFLLRYEMDIPLVVIGEGKKYKEKVKDYIRQNGLGKKIIFLSENSTAMQSDRFRNAMDFPAIYQSAIAMVYPSIFEGFGIPVLEALWSRLPVITSNVSCLPEAGGEGAYYVNPLNAEEIARAMKRIYKDKEFAEEMKDKGWLHAQKFTQKKCADEVMKVYEEVVNGS
ncbi:MAG TPA: glycosyltransferase family 1 protein [Chitinophagaceae bacterium]|nr:glycosyltransferase family 1 protein [Chitinophagaceae bacterium]